MVEMIQKLGTETNLQLAEAPQNTVNIINIYKVKCEDQLKSSKDVYMDEIAGCLDVYRNRIKKNFNKFATDVTNSTKELGTNSEDDIQPIINMIYNLFKYEKMDIYLPSFDIAAKAHAAIRWNKTRKYRANDLDDIGHMYSALPYCDYFLTEKSFYTLITQEEYDKKYSCVVAHDKEEVLTIICKILESSIQLDRFSIT